MRYFLLSSFLREQMFTREKPVDSVVAPEKKKTGLFGGFFGGAAAKKTKKTKISRDFLSTEMALEKASWTKYIKKGGCR